MLRAPNGPVVILCCWLVVGSAFAVGEEPAKHDGRKVVATGTATAHVKPDAARVTFVITTTETADKSAREANDKHVKTVKDALAAVALDKVEMEVNVLPTTITTLTVPAQNPGGPPMVQSKRAQSIFQVTLKDKDLDKLRKAAGKIAETAADNGGTSVDADANPVRGFRIRRGGGFGPGGPGGGIVDDPDPITGPTTEWLATSPAEARREAIRRAVKDAQADAEAATGSTKLTVVEITVTGSDDALVRYRMRGGDIGTDSALVPIRVEVRITYSY
jgi:uncharacterized protein YggE